MSWLLSAVLCCVLVEVASRLPFGPVLTRFANVSAKALHTVRSERISDHWKEKAMAAYARDTFTSSLKTGGLLVVLLGAALLVVLVFEQFSAGFGTFIVSWQGLASTLVFATVYFKVRQLVIHARV